MKQLKVYYLLFYFVVVFFHCNAQQIDNNNNCTISIPEVALLSLKSSSPEIVTLSPSVPVEAGASINFSSSSQSDIWVNYSSIVSNTNNTTRDLLASVSGGIPEGIKLKLFASDDVGAGGGQTGVPSGEIILSESQQGIISGIGSCYTGVGLHKGHMLTYYLERDETVDYSSIENNSYTLTVTFTLSESY